TGDTVSTMVRLSIVAVPVLVTITWYCTGPPVTGNAGVCTFVTVYAYVGGWIVPPTVFEITFSCWHTVPPFAIAVLFTGVAAHTSPIVPSTWKVSTDPGVKLRPEPTDHTYRVPVPAMLVAAAAPKPAAGVVTTPVT